MAFSTHHNFSIYVITLMSDVFNSVADFSMFNMLEGFVICSSTTLGRKGSNQGVLLGGGGIFCYEGNKTC
jgi:hypothetical protein